MLSEYLEKKVENVDILTDFDQVMIKEQSPIIQLCAYLLYLRGHKYVGFIKNLITKYIDYKKNGDVASFYSMLDGCPADIIDDTIEKYKQNERWSKLIERLGLKKVGVVSRNDYRIILKYLEKFKKRSLEISIIAANIPEIKDDFYTGKAELIVNNGNLVDFIEKRDYICGHDEKRILENSGIHSIKAGRGLYICSRNKIFHLQWNTRKF